MNTKNREYNVRPIEDILKDPTCRLDVTYWKQFAVDFNKQSQFEIKTLMQIGDIRDETIEQQTLIKDVYYRFKITYTGKVELKDPIPIDEIKSKDSMKVVKTDDLVLSRINASNGSVGIIQEFQNDAICTNETHVFSVADPTVDVRYLHIVLRHPYYRDLILSQSTGASIERKRLSEKALLSFEVPVPPLPKQLELIRQVEQHEDVIRNNTINIERLRKERNRFVLKELGIDLVYEKSNEEQYPLMVSDILANQYARFDFEHNKPSFDMIGKIEQCKYPLVEIGSKEPSEKILLENITSGSTPVGGIYPIKGIPFVQAGNVCENGLDMSEHEYITSEFHKSLSRSRLTGNEILVTIAGTIGRVGVNTEITDGNVNQAIAVLRLNDKMLPLFLSAFLNSDAGQIQFDKYRHDFGTPNINQTELARIRVPLPSIEKQRQIIIVVKDFEQKINDALKESKKSENMRSIVFLIIVSMTVIFIFFRCKN